jgi:hypothetical protein
MQYFNGSEWHSMNFGVAKTPIKIQTNDVSNITNAYAICGGSIIGDSSALVNSRGICWSTNSNPTIALNTKVNIGDGLGNFSAYMNNLTPNTTYHVRAYASNNSGTAYGNDVVFTTNNNPADYMTFTPFTTWTYNEHDNINGTDSTFLLSSSNRDSVINGRIYHAFSLINLETSALNSEYYSKNGDIYYHFGQSKLSLINNVEEKYLSLNEPTWMTHYTINDATAIQNFDIKYTIVDPPASVVTIGNKTYTGVIKIKAEIVNLSLQIPTVNGLINVLPTVNQNIYSYYAPRYGLIKMEEKLNVFIYPSGSNSQLVNIDRIITQTDSSLQ